MAHRTSKTLAMAAAGGILAGLAGCGGSPMPLDVAVPGAPPEDPVAASGAAATSTAPEPARAAPEKAAAEKHSCGGGANGCKSSMMRERTPAVTPGASGVR